MVYLALVGQSVEKKDNSDYRRRSNMQFTTDLHVDQFWDVWVVQRTLENTFSMSDTK